MKPNTTDPARQTRRRQIIEATGSTGMILIAAGLLIPLTNLFNPELLNICKWIFCAGAIIFFAGKISVRADRSESFRIRRLRRMEFWGAACFVVAAAFWIYNAHKFSVIPSAGALTIIRDTILFSMAGAMLQIVAVWLIYFRQKKESRQENQPVDKKKQ